MHAEPCQPDDVPPTLVECWQAKAGGRYRHKVDTYRAPIDRYFGGCGPAITDVDGRYRFRIVMPGAYPGPNGPSTWRPARIHFSVLGHAFRQWLITRCYFEVAPFISLCATVQTISSDEAIGTLNARLNMEERIPHSRVAYKLDIMLRDRGAMHF